MMLPFSTLAMFWGPLLMLVPSTAIILYGTRRRHWGLIAVNGALLGVNAFLAINAWQMLGSCVLPYPEVVEFQQGMGLCPGQSAQVRIPLPQMVIERREEQI